MTPQVLRVLTECDTMLGVIIRRYTTARRRLAEVEPGFPAHTPGAGEPGGGKGFTAGSITDRLAAVRHPELEAAQRLEQLPADIFVIVLQINRRHINLVEPDLANNPNRNLRLIIWSMLITRRLIENDIEPRSHQLDQLHRNIIELHSTVTTWGHQPSTPVTDPNPHLLPDDLTGNWCRNHLRIGEREPRHRGDLCRFCDDFRREESFIPPATLLEQRRDQGGKVYERDVEPHRRAWKERNKKKRRRSA